LSWLAGVVAALTVLAEEVLVDCLQQLDMLSLRVQPSQLLLALEVLEALVVLLTVVLLVLIQLLLVGQP
jgi:hypothetical protein